MVGITVTETGHSRALELRHIYLLDRTSETFQPHFERSYEPQIDIKQDRGNNIPQFPPQFLSSFASFCHPLLPRQSLQAVTSGFSSPTSYCSFYILHKPFCFSPYTFLLLWLSFFTLRHSLLQYFFKKNKRPNCMGLLGNFLMLTMILWDISMTYTDTIYNNGNYLVIQITVGF